MATAAHEHHPLIRAVTPSPVLQTPEFKVGFLGIRTRVEFEVGMTPGYIPPIETRQVAPAPPAFNEEYFEWIDVLETAAEAKSRMVMIELGAGYGRWLVAGAKAALSRGSEFEGIGVEAEPEHFRWMRRHLLDNGVDPGEFDLIWAAVGPQPGFVPFWVGDPDAWYGQAVAHRSSTSFPDLRTRRQLRARSVLGRPPRVETAGQTVVWVPCVTLEDVLMPYPRVDLIDLDIQGLELDVLASAIDVVDARVRRLHIGTHSAEVEEGLRTLLTARGWTKINDYPCQSRATTPYGDIEFGDGVQTWLNPALAPSVSPRVAVGSEQPRPTPTIVAAPPPIAGAVEPNVPPEAGGMFAEGNEAPERAPESDPTGLLKERYRALRAKYDHVRSERDALRERLRTLKSKSEGRDKSG